MQLNLPSYNHRLRRDADGVKIYDRLRGKFVALTHEEWVRQHFVEWLIATKGYPEVLMANEVGLTLNGTQRRCDTLVADRSGKPLMVVEYKAPTVTITQTAFEQIVRYNLVFNARYIVVSNGIAHFCCEMGANGNYCFLRNIPSFTEIQNR